MWFNLILLLLALAGLIALFSLKSLETSGKKTPLERLRGRGDAFITNDLLAYGKSARAQCVSLGKRGYFLCREHTVRAGSTLLAFIHTLTLRLGEHLRKREALPPHDTETKGSVSFYLKNVLEYKRNTEEMQKKNTEHPQTQTDDSQSNTDLK